MIKDIARKNTERNSSMSPMVIKQGDEIVSHLQNKMPNRIDKLNHRIRQEIGKDTPNIDLLL
jgi:hypothetical protein